MQRGEKGGEQRGEGGRGVQRGEQGGEQREEGERERRAEE